MGMLEDGTEEIMGAKDFKFGPSLFPILPSPGTPTHSKKENGLEPFYERFSTGTTHLSTRIPIHSGFFKQQEQPILFAVKNRP
jgi:hypothetical protein